MNAVAPIVEDRDHVRFREKVLPDLRRLVGDNAFEAWFATLKLDRIRGETAYLTVLKRFYRNWIQTHYERAVLRVLTGAFPDVRKVVISSNGLSVKDAPSPKCEPAAALAENDRSSATPVRKVQVSPAPHLPRIDSASTFDNFIAGRSNRLAFEAARSLGMDALGLASNPLYFYGTPGQGKTHLLQAIANARKWANSNVLYLSAEDFKYRFATTIQVGAAFIEALRPYDMLVIDDVHFLQGKSRHDFGRTVAHFVESGRPAVLAGDRAPRELDGLDARERSILSGGLALEVLPPDSELRIELLKSFAARLGMSLSPEVAAYVATRITESARDLSGAANRLKAYSSLSAGELTEAVAQEAIRDMISATPPRRVRIDEIQRLTAAHYSVTVHDIMSARRTANIVRPRQIAMYLAKQLTLRSLPEIGRRFGGRDHTTILHAVRKIESQCKTDSEFAAEVEGLRLMLEAA